MNIKGRRRAMLCVVAVALGLRLGYLLETRELPTVRHLVGDASGYHEWAGRIADGAWLGSEPFYQAPLYPYALAVVFKVFGDQVWMVRIVQAIWGAAAVGLLALGAARMFGHRAGILAGIMLALYAPALFFDGIVQKTSLGCVLMCATMAVMATAQTWKRRAMPALLLGVLVALLSLVRENALAWIPIIGLWVAVTWRGAQGWGRAIAVYGIGVGIILLPIGVRNAVVSGEWSITTFQAGPNFYIGNSAQADGRYQPLVRGHETPTFERQDATELAQRAAGRKLTAREVSTYWMARAWKDIGDDPGRWVRLMTRKLLMVVNAYEVSDVESQYIHEDSSVVLSLLGRVWHFGILCPLGVVGVVATRRQWRYLWVYYALMVSMALAVAVFYVLARYRFPLVPLLIPFAAVGCVWLWDRATRREFGAMFPPMVAAIAVGLIVNQPLHDERRLDALASMNVGVALAQAGDMIAATTYFESAVARHPESPEANNNLAQALALQGEYGRAIEHYERALAAAPSLPGLHYNLAVSLEQIGRVEEAFRFYKQAIERDPSDADARAATQRLRSAH